MPYISKIDLDNIGMANREYELKTGSLSGERIRQGFEKNPSSPKWTNKKPYLENIELWSNLFGMSNLAHKPRLNSSENPKITRNNKNIIIT